MAKTPDVDPTTAARTYLEQEHARWAKRGTPVTKDIAATLMRTVSAHFNVQPEVAAMALMRRIDSWDEHTAILQALDLVLREG